MTTTQQKPWTIERFLAWEESQPGRYEFDGFRSVAMTGGTVEHDAIQVNLLTELKTRLRGKPCRVHGNSLKIEVMGSIRTPDAFITCKPVPRGSMVAPGPVAVFEVLSKGTARTDRMVKNREYAATASIRRYVMLEQAAIEGMMFVRTGAEDWIGHILGPDTVLQMPEAGIDLPLAALYDGIDLSAPDLSAQDLFAPDLSTPDLDET